MKKYSAKVIVCLKDEVKDTQGLSVDKMLKRLDIEQNAQMRAGRYYSFELSAASDAQATQKLDFICKEVLSNPVVEKYEIFSFEELK